MQEKCLTVKIDSQSYQTHYKAIRALPGYTIVQYSDKVFVDIQYSQDLVIFEPYVWRQGILINTYKLEEDEQKSTLWIQSTFSVQLAYYAKA